MADATLKLSSIDDAVLKRILDALKSLQFGAVEITVHEGRVVQIDRRERFRLDKNGRD